MVGCNFDPHRPLPILVLEVRQELFVWSGTSPGPSVYLLCTSLGQTGCLWRFWLLVESISCVESESVGL